MESEFTKIYENNYWGNLESVSGAGSTISYTKNLRKNLSLLFGKYNINSVFDAPCGDFNWMKLVMEESDIQYIGGDIVQELIDSNEKRYQNEKTKFIHFDITRNTIPTVDLWLCRDCFIHLPYSDITKSLINFLKSEASYILTTTHINDGGFKNKNIVAGDFRYLDLFSAPFSLSLPPVCRIQDWEPPYRPCEMILLAKEHAAQIVDNTTKQVDK